MASPAQPAVLVRILLVDDREPVRLLKRFLSTDNPEWEIRDCDKAIDCSEQTRAWNPDVVILDAPLRDLSCQETVKQVREPKQNRSLFGAERTPSPRPQIRNGSTDRR